MQLFNKSKSFFISNLLLFIILLLWNYYQPFTADDYGYIGQDVLHNLSLVSFVHYRYLTWTGRISAESLTSILFSKTYLPYFIYLINILNACALLTCLNLIYKFLFGNEQSTFKFWVVTTFYIAFFLVVKNFSQDFLWKTVTIQYLYGFTLLLLLIWDFYSNCKNRNYFYIPLYHTSNFFRVI